MVATTQQGHVASVSVAGDAKEEEEGTRGLVSVAGVGGRGACAVGAMASAILTACGGGESGDGRDPPTRAQSDGLAVDFATGMTLVGNLPGADGPEPARTPGMTEQEAARFLTQATFGIRSAQEIRQLQDEGIAHWLWRQYDIPCVLHTTYLDAERIRKEDSKPGDEMSYEAVWRQWLFEEGQLRARVAFALSQIFVISNIAPDLRPYAMSSYMDMLNRNAFGNYRTLLKEVTLHPAMGYYLNMLQSRKEDAKKGTHPNENYAREVLQLFSIGLVKLDIRGAVISEGGKPVPTYGEAEVKGFAKAFSGWSFGGEGNADPKMFWKAQENNEANWLTSMLPFADYHDTGTKPLLDGRVLPAGQSQQKDLDDALDCIFMHPNVGPFIGRQLIQRLVTSNPSGDYIEHVARAFNDNGAGVRGDLKAVVEAVLTHREARDASMASQPGFGKLREPVLRMTSMLRAFNAKSPSITGRTDLHDLDSPDDSLGQSPLLAPSVFNFFSPNYRQAGSIAKAGLVSPEFQITTESSVVGCFNTFARLFRYGGYGWGEQSRLTLDFTPWDALALQPDALVDRMNLLLCSGGMGATMRQRLITMLNAMPSKSWQLRDRIVKAFTLLAVSPDFVIQK